MNPDEKNIPQDTENCKALRPRDPFYALYVLTNEVVFLYPLESYARNLFTTLLIWAHLSETPEGLQARETIRKVFSALLPLVQETKNIIRRRFKPRDMEGKQLLASCVMSEILLKRFESLCRSPLEVMPGQDYGELVGELVEKVFNEANLTAFYTIYDEPPKKISWKHLGFDLGELANKTRKLQDEEGLPLWGACRKIANQAIEQQKQKDPDVIKKAAKKLASSTGKDPRTITRAEVEIKLADAIRHKI